MNQLRDTAGENGWSTLVPLIGSHADVMFVHLRASLDDIGIAQRALAASPLMDFMEGPYAFLSVTEGYSLYHLTAQLAQEMRSRSGRSVGDE